MERHDSSIVLPNAVQKELKPSLLGRLKLALKCFIQNWLRKHLDQPRLRSIGLWFVSEMDRRDRMGKTLDSRLQAALEKLSPELRVVRGPFAGMRYPELRARGSSIAPKVLGTYEEELYSWIEDSGVNYRTIIDLGCAEGYYAVGLARRNPESKVYAIDIDPYALRCCRELSLLNGVYQQVQLIEGGPLDIVKAIPLSSPTLVVCDVEGYEWLYLDPEAWPELKQCDLLVEVHEFFCSGLHELLRKRFSDTHQIQHVDALRRNPDNYPELSDLPHETALMLLDEDRPLPMGWLLMKAEQRS